MLCKWVYNNSVYSDTYSSAVTDCSILASLYPGQYSSSYYANRTISNCDNIVYWNTVLGTKCNVSSENLNLTASCIATLRLADTTSVLSYFICKLSDNTFNFDCNRMRVFYIREFYYSTKITATTTSTTTSTAAVTTIRTGNDTQTQSSINNPRTTQQTTALTRITQFSNSSNSLPKSITSMTTNPRISTVQPIPTSQTATQGSSTAKQFIKSTIQSSSTTTRASQSTTSSTPLTSASNINSTNGSSMNDTSWYTVICFVKKFKRNLRNSTLIKTADFNVSNPSLCDKLEPEIQHQLIKYYSSKSEKQTNEIMKRTNKRLDELKQLTLVELYSSKVYGCIAISIISILLLLFIANDTVPPIYRYIKAVRRQKHIKAKRKNRIMSIPTRKSYGQIIENINATEAIILKKMINITKNND